MFKTLKQILNNECPNCQKGKVFREKNLICGYHWPKMYRNCLNCDYQFEKEPGFFFGAMYVSYALTVGESLVTYLIAHQFFTVTFDWRIIYIIASVIVLLSFFNIRLSRMIWIYIFYENKV